MSFCNLRRCLFGLIVALGCAPGVLALDIQFDYSYDAGGFFAAQERRDVLENAASLLEGLVTDNLAGISPAGGPSGTWTASFVNPYNGSEATEVDRTIPANTIVVFVGAHDLPGNEVGFGGPGGYFTSGTTAWNTIVSTRGQAGAAGTFPTDFGPWGGSIAFDTLNSSGQLRDWHFGIGTAPFPGSTDFYTTAVHELMHVLGYGTSKSWEQNVAPGAGVFNGPNSVAVYGGPVPLISGGEGSHWAEGTQGRSTWTGLMAEAAMDPTQNLGARKTLTQLDLAALQDIGWTLSSTATPLPGDANRDGRVDLTDFGRLKQFFGFAFGPQRGDFDGDGKVDLNDFGILKTNFGRTSAAAAAVPEPATATLAVLGFLGIAWRVRRRT
jgi:hypothetical protein